MNAKFPPVPFYTSSEGMWDLSGTRLKKGLAQSVSLSFEKVVECTDEMKQVDVQRER